PLYSRRSWLQLATARFAGGDSRRQITARKSVERFASLARRALQRRVCRSRVENAGRARRRAPRLSSVHLARGQRAARENLPVADRRQHRLGGLLSGAGAFAAG